MSVIDLMVDNGCIESERNYPVPGVEQACPIRVKLSPLLYDPELCFQVLDSVLEHFDENSFDTVLGVKNSGALWGWALASYATFRYNTKKHFIAIAPEHIRMVQAGMDIAERELYPEKKYLVLDDFITTAYSIGEFQRFIKSKRLDVSPYCIFNYGIVKVPALVDMEQLLKVCERKGVLTKGLIANVRQWKETAKKTE